MPASFGLEHIWSQGDVVTRLILLALLAMSVLSWSVMLFKGIGVWRHKQNAQACEDFWHAHDFDEGIKALDRHHGKIFRDLALTGKQATAHHQSSQVELHDKLDISDWLTRCLRNNMDEHTSQLQSGLAILASIGSTAPFVGLFGTVWGIYHALVTIGATGNAGIEAVAGPIGETLIMTALGLGVAIPAVLGYNTLVRGNKFVIARMSRFAHDLHAYFLTGSRVDPKRGTHGI